MNRIFIYIVVSAFLSLSYGQTKTFTDDDKIELIKRTLKVALVEKQLPDYNLLKDTTQIILSSENIRSSWIPQFSDFHLIVLSPDSIKSLANYKGDFLFLAFKSFSVKENADIQVTLANEWSVSQKSSEEKLIFMSGGGLSLFFYKEFGQWKERPTRESWIH